MKFASFVFILAMAQFAIAADDGAQARKDLLGVWKGGVDGGAQGHVLTVKKSVVTCVKVAGSKKSDLGGGVVKIDLTKKPFRMDAKGTLGGQKGRAWFGIYSLEGNTLKWCVNASAAPTEFKTGNGNFYLILKRQ